MVRFENWYERRIKHALKGNNVYWYFSVTFFMLIAVIMLFGMSLDSGRTKVEFFPDNKPNEIYTYIEYPQGTSIEKTNDNYQGDRKKGVCCEQTSHKYKRR